jgi:hypothetical protein
MSWNLISLPANQAVRLIHDSKLRLEALIDRDPAVRAFTHFDPAQARAAVVIGKTVTTEFSQDHQLSPI